MDNLTLMRNEINNIGNLEYFV